MPTGFDNFTSKAHLDYTHLSKEKIRNRELLKSTLIAAGLVPLATEWWHYSLPNRKQFPLLNLDFSSF